MNKQDIKQVIVPIASLRREPNNDSELETQCLFGEEVNIFSQKNNWFLCKTRNDSYKGWIKKKCLSDVSPKSHKIINLITHIYKEPCIKSQIVEKLYFSSTVLAKKFNSHWSIVFFRNKQFFVFNKHVTPITNRNKQWIETSYNFLGAPYLWGGKTFSGIDCSGLVQLALSDAGIFLPRNSSNQLLYDHPKIKNVSMIEEKCLIFWSGHVAISIKKNKILHSNAYHMCVKTEPLETALKRINKKYGEIIKVKKILL